MNLRQSLMWALLVIIILFWLSGCAAPEPRVVKEPVEVKVPVMVRCLVPRVERPSWAFSDVKPDDPRFLIRGGRALMAEIEQRRAYELELEAAIDACRK